MSKDFHRFDRNPSFGTLGAVLAALGAHTGANGILGPPVLRSSGVSESTSGARLVCFLGTCRSRNRLSKDEDHQGSTSC